MTEALEWKNIEFVREIEKRSGTNVSACLQCHKCSTGCPIAPDTDMYSSQIMRMINLGLEKEILQSQAIWLCSSCEACTTRCPMSIKIADVMDSLRILAIERKETLADKRVKQFNMTFLNSVNKFGRVFELGMMAVFKFKSKDLFSDMDKAVKMLWKRKLRLFPTLSKNKKEIKRIFKQAKDSFNNRLK